MLFKRFFAFISRIVQSPSSLGKSQGAAAVLQKLQPTSSHLNATIRRRRYEETIGGRGRLHRRSSVGAVGLI